jgi:hypothetical protein
MTTATDRTGSGTNRTDDLAAAASDATTTAKGIAADVADKASAAAARLPDAANEASLQLGRAGQLIQSESDEVLTVGTALSLGLALGLLLGGANRLLVLLALIPGTAMGFTLFDRHNGGSRAATRSR